MKIPKVALISQTATSSEVSNVEEVVRAQLNDMKIASKVESGQTVAIGCTSRGIPDYPRVIKTIVDELKRVGLRPFLFPAMGSHGASTAEGQADFLRNYGLTEEFVGAPIVSHLDVIKIGTTEDLSLDVLVDKQAFAADHIIVVNRIKTHTDFINEFESGIIKILAVGLGKPEGAAYYHKAIIRWGFPRVLRDVTTAVLKTGKILFGVGVVESFDNKIAEIKVVDTSNFELLLKAESQLLANYKSSCLYLPLDRIDVLVIDEVGKDISGTGADTKVVGRINKPLISDEPESPKIKRIIALGLSKHSSGSPGCSGIMDFVSKNYDEATNWEAVIVNGVLACMPEFCRIPPIMPTDRATVQAAVDSLGLYETHEVKLVRILNTGRLDKMFVSEACLRELESNSNIKVLSGLADIEFDEQGTIVPFPL